MKICIFIMILILRSQVFATEVFIDSKKVETLTEIKEQISNIPNLLKILSKKYQDIAVYKKNQEYQFFMKTKRKVSEIVYKDALYLSQFFIKTQIGGVLHPQLLLQDSYMIEESLKKQGYLNSTVEKTTFEVQKEDNVKVIFHIKLGQNCQILRIQFVPTLPISLFETLPPETNCSIATVEEYIRKQKMAFRNLGYLQCQMTVGKEIFNEDRTHAEYVVNTHLGPLYKIQIMDTQNQKVLEDFKMNQLKFFSLDTGVISIEETKSQVIEHYQKNGYLKFVVTKAYLEKKEDINLINFEVERGPQYYWGSVSLSGLSPKLHDEVLAALNSKRTWSNWNPIFVQVEAESFLSEIILILNKKGYLKAKIIRNDQSYVKNNVDIDITIDPGDHYEINKEIIVFKDYCDANLTDSHESKITFENIERLQLELSDILKSKGYFNHELDHVLECKQKEEDEQQCELTWNITCHGHTKLRGVLLQGPTYRKNKRIIEDIGFYPPENLAQQKIDRAREALLYTNLFSQVFVDLRFEKDSKEWADLVWKLQPKGKYSLNITPSYGSLTGYRLSTEFIVYDLNQDGLRFTALMTLDQDKNQRMFGQSKQYLGHRITLGLDEPYLRIGTWVAPFHGFFNIGSELVPNESSTSRHSYQISPGIKRKYFLLSGTIETQFYLLRDIYELMQGNNVSLEVFDKQKSALLETLATIELDFRNEKSWPINGSWTKFSLSYSDIYSDLNYFRISGEGSTYFPIIKNISHSFLWGFLRFYSSQIPPSSRRSGLINKGIIRGFPEGGLVPGPLIQVDACQRLWTPILTPHYLYAKNELRYLFPRKFITQGLKVGLISFLDTGVSFFTSKEEQSIQNAFLSLKGKAYSPSCQMTDVTLVDNPSMDNITNYFSNFYAGAGVGVRFLIADVASLFIDWGYPIRQVTQVKRPQENQWDFLGMFKTKYPGTIHLGIEASL